MSEYIALSMVKVEKQEDIYPIAQSFCDAACKNMREYIKENTPFTYRDPKRIESASSLIDILRKMFTFRFVYYPSLKLFCIVGTDYIKEMNSLFPMEWHYQNSCDQDYDWECYDNLGFPEYAEPFKTMTKEQLLEKHDWLDEEDISTDEQVEYWRKSECYKSFWEDKMHVDELLYGHEDSYMVRFTMSPLLFDDDIYHTAFKEWKKIFGKKDSESEEKSNE